MPLQISIANKSEASLLRSLLQLHLHELCPFTHQELKDDGFFEFPKFDEYFENRDRVAYIFRLKGRLAGFALVQQKESVSGTQFNTISDLFILETYRHIGLGEECARTIFDRYEGHWSIAVRDENAVAMSFWKQVIFRYASGQQVSMRDPHSDAVIFEFTSPPPVPTAQPIKSLLSRPITRRTNAELG